MSECIDKDTGVLLHAYEIRALSDSEIERFEIHLLACEYCFNEVSAFRGESSLLASDEGVKAIVREAARKFRPPESIAKRLWRYIWPDVPFVFKPAFVYLVLFMISLPIYLSYKRYWEINLIYQQEGPLRGESEVSAPILMETEPKPNIPLSPQKKIPQVSALAPMPAMKSPGEGHGLEGVVVNPKEEVVPPPEVENIKPKVSKKRPEHEASHISVSAMALRHSAVGLGKGSHGGLNWGIIRSVQSITLLPGHQTTEKTLSIGTEREGLINFLFRGAVPEKGYRVVVESQEGNVIFQEDDFRDFDENETGHLILSLSNIKPGAYRLIVADLGERSPIKREYYFLIKE